MNSDSILQSCFNGNLCVSQVDRCRKVFGNKVLVVGSQFLYIRKNRVLGIEIIRVKLLDPLKHHLVVIVEENRRQFRF